MHSCPVLWCRAGLEETSVCFQESARPWRQISPISFNHLVSNKPLNLFIQGLRSPWLSLPQGFLSYSERHCVVNHCVNPNAGIYHSALCASSGVWPLLLQCPLAGFTLLPLGVPSSLTRVLVPRLGVQCARNIFALILCLPLDLCISRHPGWDPKPQSKFSSILAPPQTDSFSVVGLPDCPRAVLVTDVFFPGSGLNENSSPPLLPSR